MDGAFCVFAEDTGPPEPAPVYFDINLSPTFASGFFYHITAHFLFAFVALLNNHQKNSLKNE